MSRFTQILATGLLAGFLGFAQSGPSYLVTTVAGSIPNQEGIPATEALMFGVYAIASGPDGTIYVGDSGAGGRKIGTDGIISSFSDFGLANSVAVDSAGSLYSVGGSELYKRRITGESDTFRPFSLLPVVTNARLNAVAVDRNDQVFISAVVGTSYGLVARVAADGSAQIIAGLGSRVPLEIFPNHLAFGRNGEILMTTRSRIFRLSADGVVSLVAGNGQYGQPVTGSPATQSPFTQIGAIASTETGQLYVVDQFSRSVVSINPEGVIDQYVWSGSAADLAIEPGGSLLILDADGFVLRTGKDGTKAIVAGRSRFARDDGPATLAVLNQPSAVVPDPEGGFFIADTRNNRIRRVSSDNVISTVAGTGQSGFSGDGGAGTEAQIAGPAMLALDSSRNLYFASEGFLRLRMLRPDGIVETVAGTGVYDDSGDDGVPAEATFKFISGVAVDKAGSVYISDSVSNKVRVIRNGVISTYAGTGDSTVADDGGPAKSTQVVKPTVLTVLDSGDLVVFESGALRLRKINSVSGEITTLTRTAPLGVPGDSSAANLCNFGSVSGLASDSDGNLFVAGECRICRLDKDGRSWATGGSPRNWGFGGDDGPATDARFGCNLSLAVDSSGSVLVADRNNQRIRKLTPMPDPVVVEAH